MRKFVVVILVVLALFSAVIGGIFAYENLNPLVIHLFGLSSAELPTFLWLIVFLLMGFFLGYLVFLGKNVSLRIKLRQARSELKRRSTNPNRIVPSQSTSPKQASDQKDKSKETK